MTIKAPLSFWVAGIPAPQGSLKHVGRGRMVPASKKLKPWRDAVTAAAREALGASETITGAPTYVRLDFVLPRPTQTVKSRPTPHAIKRPDVDKLSRAVCDAITDAGVWADDSQVVTLWATKRIAEVDESPGVQIRIEVGL